MKMVANLMIGELGHPNHYDYAQEVIKNAVESYMKNGDKLVELGTDYENLTYFRTHRLDKVAGIVKDVRIKDNELNCELELLDTLSGEMVKELASEGKLSLNPRMVLEDISKTEENGKTITNIGKANIISFDFVKE